MSLNEYGRGSIDACDVILKRLGDAGISKDDQHYGSIFDVIREFRDAIIARGIEELEYTLGIDKISKKYAEEGYLGIPAEEE